MQKKQEVILGGTRSYSWNTFECEICKTPYPYVFRVGDRKYELIEIPRPTGDFIILETLTIDESSGRSVYVLEPAKLNLNLPNKHFKLGRGNDQDVRINDISVSRCHAIIKFEIDKFILQDNFSKFGTLQLIKN